MNNRQEHVAEELRHQAAQFIATEANRTSLVTVTRVTVSPDLKKATVYVTVLPDTEEQDVLHFLMRRGTDLRSYVSSKTNLRRLPFFEFAIDEGEKNRQRIDELL